MEIPKKYNPKLIEYKIYRKWIEQDCFASYPNKKNPYTIIMPPPNITGILHIGHILNNTIQDVLIRIARMKGNNACWIPGIDHASIATEAKVVDFLKKKGLSKIRLGRKKFLFSVLKWSKQHKNIIIDQLQKIGCSCDWNRFQFTMNDQLYHSVKMAFINLYEKGYIYRDYHLVNWDPKARTTISDEEVIYEERLGKLYFIKYKIRNETNYVTIATTRPETIFGDTAICVHPDDPRYFNLKNKYVEVPITNMCIPIIQDTYVDKNFGSGCFKVTPAHDLHDKKIGDKHNLNIINIFNEDGTINHHGFHYKGMKPLNARTKLVQELMDLGHLIKVEKLKHKIGISERTSSIVEYRLSMQWFVKMKDLSIPAIEAVKNGDITFYPSKMKKIYLQWMNNIHDWNISRQLWWGHRIPVFYYGKEINDFVVAENLDIALVKARKKGNNRRLNRENIWQDSDVLDTWFSSWLLPITVFDGIQNPDNKDICYYYPTENLVTGSDILFFWVARMIMSSFFFKKKKPFKKVLFTGIVRDSDNNKISKSLNNFENPTKLIDKYGADAVRFSLMLKSHFGKDFHFKEEMCIQGRNFLNKIWNSFRLIKSWKVDSHFQNDDKFYLPIIEWIQNRFYFILEMIEKKFLEYKLDELLMIIYKFFWIDFCSWFLEIIKSIYHDHQKISHIVYLKIMDNYKNIMKLLHPYVPFISEEIWSFIDQNKSKSLLITSFWPEKQSYDINILYSFENIINMITKIRNIRMKNNIPNNKSCILFCDIKEKKYHFILLKLANVSKIIPISKKPKNSFCFPFFLGLKKFFLSFSQEGPISFFATKYVSNLEKKIKYLYGLLSIIRKNLSNDQYVKSVPKRILLKEKQKEQDTLIKINQLTKYLKNIKQNFD
ncbi:valine--tRNA ligase [Blattabacterium cuenoti]|uniref:valine--tRNA ligase n=1 Tax=Blattabacterium cuenoti TaxID=1653831 RepID=UPI00163C4E85|nr:valine--tRNA ligase [Blattabacterium cuenoti]